MDSRAAINDNWQSQATLEWHGGSVHSVAFSPDGTTLASGHGDGTVRLWDVEIGGCKVSLEANTYGVSSVAFSPNGRTLATGDEANEYNPSKVRLWDVDTGQLLSALAGHGTRIASVAFSPDDKTLASGGYDGTVRLWDVDTGQQKAILTGYREGYVHSIAYSPDGYILASGSLDGTILLWDMSPYIMPQSTTEVVRQTLEPTLDDDVQVDALKETTLVPNVPNPFNCTTQLAYHLTTPGPVRLEIYNVLGQPVRTLIDEFQSPGAYQVHWSGHDQGGVAVGAGVYLTRFSYPGGVQTRRLLYLK